MSRPPAPLPSGATVADDFDRYREGEEREPDGHDARFRRQQPW